jgi:hypothetical protein
MRVMIVGLLACALLPWAEAPSAGQETKDQDASDPQVEVVGLNVWRMPRTPNLNMGSRSTTVSLLVKAPKAAIVGLDDIETRLSEFRDDHDANLIKDELRPGGFELPNHYAFDLLDLGDDGHSALIDITAPDIPSSGARTLFLQGELVLRIGDGLKTAEQKDVALKTGETVKVGPVPLELDLDDPTFALLVGGEARGETFVDLKMTQNPFPFPSESPLQPIKKIEFLTDNGRQIQARRESYPGDVATNLNVLDYFIYALDTKKGDRCTVRVVYYDHIETLRIPFHVKAGLGL